MGASLRFTEFVLSDVGPDFVASFAYPHVTTPTEAGKPRVHGIWTFDLESGEAVPWKIEGAEKHRHQRPIFSPDGETIAYRCSKTVRDDLWVGWPPRRVDRYALWVDRPCRSRRIDRPGSL